MFQELGHFEFQSGGEAEIKRSAADRCHQRHMDSLLFHIIAILLVILLWLILLWLFLLRFVLLRLFLLRLLLFWRISCCRRRRRTRTVGDERDAWLRRQHGLTKGYEASEQRIRCVSCMPGTSLIGSSRLTQQSLCHSIEYPNRSKEP